MKQLFTLFIAGILGGVAALSLQSSFYKSDNLQNPNQNPNAKLVTSTIALPPVTFDFVKASELSTEVVVHIVARESNELALKRYEENRSKRRNPFDDFFGQDGYNDFFSQDFFGRNFYQPKNGSGSGVIISSEGYIVTNNHVVGFADDILVTLADGRELKGVKIGTDPSTDLAVIKVEVDGNLPTLQYADSDKIKVGEWVLAVGNPFSYLTSTVTAGIVSAKGRDLDIINGVSDEKAIEEFIQTDAAVNPGNSGGALVNANGELIGINTAIATPTGVYAGYSFAIPSNLVKRIVADIIENGDIERVNLGVAGYDVDEEVANEFGLKVGTGFYVDTVEKKSAAQFAGILPGDVVVSIEGKPIQKFEDIVENMKYVKIGDEVSVKVIRGGKEKKIEVRFRKGL